MAIKFNINRTFTALFVVALICVFVGIADACLPPDATCTDWTQCCQGPRRNPGECAKGWKWPFVPSHRYCRYATY